MHLIRGKEGDLTGIVLNPEAVVREGERVPEPYQPDQEPTRKRRVNEREKYQEINEAKRAVQERLLPALQAYEAWLSNQPSQVIRPPPSSYPNVDHTDWCELFSRRFELWPKISMPGCLIPEALFGRVHSNLTSDPVSGQMNIDSKEIIAEVDIPPKSRFLISHGVQSLGPLLQEAESRKQRYSLLVIDPPWENASVRRGGGGYNSLPAGELCKLPVRELMDNQGVCFLWVTNRPRIQTFLSEVLLQRWGLKHVRVWYWIKTARGKPVIPLDCLHRHCYEPLLVLAPISQDPAELAYLPEDGFALFSEVREHSRKPYLGTLISELFPRFDPQRMDPHDQIELFAREMHEGWTSWGNEVLKFQAKGRL
jgi:N6-adenosine-specific RNA methylase IME4